jgi:hypothetical protein
VSVQSGVLVAAWKDDLRDGTITRWDPGPKCGVSLHSLGAGAADPFDPMSSPYPASPPLLPAVPRPDPYHHSIVHLLPLLPMRTRNAKLHGIFIPTAPTRTQGCSQPSAELCERRSFVFHSRLTRITSCLKKAGSGRSALSGYRYCV